MSHQNFWTNGKLKTNWAGPFFKPIFSVRVIFRIVVGNNLQSSLFGGIRLNPLLRQTLKDHQAVMLLH